VNRRARQLQLPDVLQIKMLLSTCEAHECDQAPMRTFKDHSGSLMLCHDHSEQFADEMARCVQDYYRLEDRLRWEATMAEVMASD